MSKVDLFEVVGVADGVATAVGRQVLVAHCAAVVNNAPVGRQSE